MRKELTRYEIKHPKYGDLCWFSTGYGEEGDTEYALPGGIRRTRLQLDKFYDRQLGYVGRIKAGAPRGGARSSFYGAVGRDVDTAS